MMKGASFGYLEKVNAESGQWLIASFAANVLGVSKKDAAGIFVKAPRWSSGAATENPTRLFQAPTRFCTRDSQPPGTTLCYLLDAARCLIAAAACALAFTLQCQ